MNIVNHHLILTTLATLLWETDDSAFELCFITGEQAFEEVFKASPHDDSPKSQLTCDSL
jgi:hypothetical protein